jgi:hypothetical protein
MTGKMIYAKLKKVGSNNCASFSHNKVLRRAHCEPKMVPTCVVNPLKPLEVTFDVS